MQTACGIGSSGSYLLLMDIDAETHVADHHGFEDAPVRTAAPRWLALATHAHKEDLAVKNLIRQGFEAYCPMLRKTVRHARRAQDVLRPLFPGYVFAAAASGASWRSMHSTVGVRRIIAFGEQPCLLSNDFISALRIREVDGAVVRPSQPYSIGQQVKLTGGAFEGLVATIVAVDEKARLVLLLNLLNQSVRVRADMHSVREL